MFKERGVKGPFSGLVIMAKPFMIRTAGCRICVLSLVILDSHHITNKLLLSLETARIQKEKKNQRGYSLAMYLNLSSVNGKALMILS